jgi:hypothetical protein
LFLARFPHLPSTKSSPIDLYTLYVPLIPFSLHCLSDLFFNCFPNHGAL